MTAITVPTRDEVSLANQTIFDDLEKRLGFVPNLYATFAHSANALPSYLALQGARNSLEVKAREVISLVVSQVNGCDYCLAAHTVQGRANGFTDEQILEIRGGRASFDAKLNALARLVCSIATERGHADPMCLQSFFDAGWTNENLVDVIVAVGARTITNYMHGTTRVPVDFPAALERPA
jgi:AhpD family alkylhydroperoxidase